MPLGVISRLLRSMVSRLVALNALLLVISMVAGALGGWIATRGVVEREARNRIELESHVIALEAQRGGLDRVREIIRAKAERPGELGRASCGERRCKYVEISVGAV